MSEKYFAIGVLAGTALTTLVLVLVVAACLAAEGRL